MMQDMGPEARTEEEQEYERQVLAERQAAYAAVSKAIASYRWWGWTSISCAVRMWVTGIKLRLGMRLWP